MQIHLNLWTALSLFGIIQGILLSALLFSNKRGNLKANRILAILILLFSLKLAEFAGYWTSFFNEFPHLLFTTYAFPFLFGVLLFFYASALTNDKWEFKNSDMLHFIPFVLQSIIMLRFYALNGNVKIEILQRLIQSDNPILSTDFYLTGLLQNAHMLIYSLLTLKILSLNSSQISGKGLSIENIKFKWIKKLTTGFFILILLNILHLLSIRVFGYKYITETDAVIMIYSAVMIYFIGYLALKQPEIITGISRLKNGAKYMRSGLTDKLADIYHKKLLDAMIVDKIFANNNLSLNDLSNTLDIPAHHLSQVLNEKIKLNYFDFVNYYRIEEAKRLLQDTEYEPYTILTIAHDVGFNNKASFNSAFRKFTKRTPSQYRKEAKSLLSS
jgi:AraC-like DNA-binding protein